MRRTNLNSAILVLCGTLAVAGRPHASPNLPAPWQDWSQLRLKVRKLLFFTGKVELQHRSEADREVLETQTFAKFLGSVLTRTRTRTTIDPSTGRSLEYVSLSPKHGRHYVFDEERYTVEKLSPSNGYGAPLEQWEVTSRKQFDYPAARNPGSAPPLVLDYYGMILFLRDAELRKLGDEVRIYVATSKGPQDFRVRVSDVRRSTRTFRDLKRDIKRKVAVRELRLRVTPADPKKADEGFLNMEGETELWVEAGSRTLLEINGKIPSVPGRVRVTLDSIG